MNDGDHDVAEELVQAANESIAALLSANKESRVGVVLYSGSSSSSSNYSTAAMLLKQSKNGRRPDGIPCFFLAVTNDFV
jgi:hypothetical protein